MYGPYREGGRSIERATRPALTRTTPGTTIHYEQLERQTNASGWVGESTTEKPHEREATNEHERPHALRCAISSYTSKVCRSLFLFVLRNCRSSLCSHIGFLATARGQKVNNRKRFQQP